MGKISIRVLGGPSILTREGQELSDLGAKSTALLNILALSPNHICTRERLLGLLWGSRSQQQAQASLRQALSEIRKALNSDDIIALITDRTNVKLDTDLVEVDATCCTDLLRSADRSSHEKAAGIIIGEFTTPTSINEEYYDEWVAHQHDRLKASFQDNLCGYMRAALQSSELQSAQTFARALLTMERGDEEAHRALMQVFAQQGNRTLALRQFEICAEALQSQYEAEPDFSTIEVYERIKVSSEQALKTGPKLSRNVPELSVGKEQCTVSSEILKVDDNDVEAGRLATEFIEQLLRALSCFRWIAISRTRLHSHLTDLGQSGSAHNIGSEPDYRIEGRVRRSMRCLQVSLEIIDVQTQNIAFSETYTGDLTGEGYIAELFVHQVAARTEERLRTSIVRAAIRRSEEDLSAVDCALLGLYGVQEMTHTSYEVATRLFELAEIKSPKFAFQYSCKALWMIFSYGQGWKRNRIEEIYELAKRATFLDPEDATSLAIFGHMEVFCFKRFDMASDLFSRAVACNPHSPFVWMMRSVFLAYCGEADAAHRDLKWSQSISSMEAQYRFMSSSAHCIVNLISRNFEESARWGRIMVGANPAFSNGVKQLLISLGQLGLADEARGYVEQLAYLEPEFSSQSFVDSYPLRQSEDKKVFLDGLKAAGAPP